MVLKGLGGKDGHVFREIETIYKHMAYLDGKEEEAIPLFTQVGSAKRPFGN